MELIKIDTDHFVVVNKTIQPVNGYYYDSFINKIKSTNGAEYGEASHCWQITHSNIGHLYQDSILPLSLQEVKELIGEVDVENKAFELAILFHNTYEKLAPAFGYETRLDTKVFDKNSANGKLMIAVCKEIYQAIKDNKAKRYTEEDLKYMFECGRNYQNNAEITFKVSMEYLLQTKTSWQVEIVDGKLKLK